MAGFTGGMSFLPAENIYGYFFIPTLNIKKYKDLKSDVFFSETLPKVVI
jgi:hypothetical protein